MGFNKNAAFQCGTCDDVFPLAAVRCSQCWRQTILGMELCDTCSAAQGRCVVCGQPDNTPEAKARQARFPNPGVTAACRAGIAAREYYTNACRILHEEFHARTEPQRFALAQAVRDSRRVYAVETAQFAAAYQEACDLIAEIRQTRTPTLAERQALTDARNLFISQSRPLSDLHQAAEKPFFDSYNQATADSQQRLQVMLAAAGRHRDERLAKAEFDYMQALRPWYERWMVSLRIKLQRAS